ncbi:MAG: hypothetical protein AVDCRST_MAG41-1469, partial [uncultured Corynebacteriales bacterium]
DRRHLRGGAAGRVRGAVVRARRAPVRDRGVRRLAAPGGLRPLAGGRPLLRRRLPPLPHRHGHAGAGRARGGRARRGDGDAAGRAGPVPPRGGGPRARPGRGAGTDRAGIHRVPAGVPAGRLPGRAGRPLRRREGVLRRVVGGPGHRQPGQRLLGVRRQLVLARLRRLGGVPGRAAGRGGAARADRRDAGGVRPGGAVRAAVLERGPHRRPLV